MSSDRARPILTRRQSKLLQQQQATPSVKPTETEQSSSSDELNQSVNRQEAEMSQFTRAMYADGIKKANDKAKNEDFENLSVIEIEDLIGLLETDFNALRNEHSALLKQAKDVDEANTHGAFYNDKEELYLETRKLFRKRLEELKPKPKQSNTQAQAEAGTMKLELKNAEIPNTWGTFDGSYSAWPSFRDRFVAVHNNADVTVARKLDLLSKALVGKATLDTSKLSTTDAQYAVVWERLVDRYEDEYRVVHELVQKVLGMRKLSSPSCHGIRQILDTMRDCLGQLEGYFDTTSWDPLLVFHVIDLLDTDTQREWERVREKKPKKSNAGTQVNEQQDTEATDAEAAAKKMNADIPSWQILEAFLEQQAKFLALSEDQRGAHGSDSRDSSRTREQGTSHANRQANRRLPASERDPCANCNGPHPIHKCKHWLEETNLAGKNHIIFQKNLCHICLKPNHNDFFCYRDKNGKPIEAKPCPRCPGRKYHNSTICPTGEAERQTAALSAQAVPSNNDRQSSQSRQSSSSSNSVKRD